MRRFITILLHFSVLFSIFPIKSSAQDIDNLKYPRLIGKWWGLPENRGGIPQYGPEGGFDGEGYGVPELEWPWNAEEVKFLRRFDQLVVDWLHVVTFYRTYTRAPVINPNEMVHNFIEGVDVEYNHNHAHGASKQDLLAKSRGGLLYFADYPQEVYTRFDMHNFNYSYFLEDDSGEPGFDPEETLHEENVKRELVDWLNPAWFAMAIGGIVSDVQPRDPGSSDIYLTTREAVDNFMHAKWDDFGYTYAMVLPLDYEGMELGNCFDDPKYEILKVTDLDSELHRLTVERGMWNTEPITFEPGQEIRPLIWMNPENWGSTSFHMNPTGYTPDTYLGTEDAGPYRFYQVVTNSVRQHHLIGSFGLAGQDIFYCDGIFLDGYQPNMLTSIAARPNQFLHGENVDLNLNGTPDCSNPPDCNNPEAIAVNASWVEEYENFLEAIRDAVDDVRGLGAEFILVTNGHPNESHYDELNGRHFEDTDNPTFQESNLLQVIQNSRVYHEDQRFEDPGRVLYFERDFDVDYDTETNLPAVRLTLALSLILSNEGAFGGIGGGYNTRHPLFGNGPQIEDYYDELAVDYYWRGCQHEDFQIENEAYLLEHKYYLGDPMNENTYPDLWNYDIPSPKWVREHAPGDLLYREFDRGLVIAHLGICANPQQQESIDTDWFDIVDGEWRNNCPGDPCHFVKILGSDSEIYNDGTNDGEHIVDGVFTFDYNVPDGVILLKEGDDFWIHPDTHIEY